MLWLVSWHLLKTEQNRQCGMSQHKAKGTPGPLCDHKQTAACLVCCIGMGSVCSSGCCHLQRSSSNPARLGFCLLKGHQSNMGPAKATHLRHFSFTPLETPYGQFKLEVDYAPAAAVNFLEQSTSPQHQAEIISDYVRGAQPADKQRQAHNALRGELTASLQGSWRQPSLATPAAAGWSCLCLSHHLPVISSCMRSEPKVPAEPPAPWCCIPLPNASPGCPADRACILVVRRACMVSVAPLAGVCAQWILACWPAAYFFVQNGRTLLFSAPVSPQSHGAALSSSVSRPVSSVSHF